MGKKRDEAETPEQKPFHNPFGGLANLREGLPSAPAKASAPVEKPGPAKAVVRYERKGRGGKEVTLVEQLGLPSKETEAWLKELKGRLGCGGIVEEGNLVFQGDQRDRLPKLLEAKGVRKISVS